MKYAVCGYFTLQLIIYITLTAFLGMLIAKFSGVMLLALNNEALYSTALLQLQVISTTIDRSLQAAPIELTHWIIKNTNELVWYDSLQNHHEGFSFVSGKILHTTGHYAVHEKKWAKKIQRVIGYGLHNCSWSFRDHQPIKGVRYGALVTTTIQAKVNSKTLSSVVATVFKARVVNGLS